MCRQLAKIPVVGTYLARVIVGIVSECALTRAKFPTRRLVLPKRIARPSWWRRLSPHAIQLGIWIISFRPRVIGVIPAQLFEH
jgi:hypothetical protein